MRSLRNPLLQAVLYFGGFALLVLWRSEQPAPGTPPLSHDRVVIASPVLTALYAGDRFLAANLETIRLSATGIDRGMADTFYLLRAHKVVADLNPCHENNYYIANALLTWGGAVDEGGDILERATACRHWDELPPFLYGFNQFFFNRNIDKAQQWLEIAAQRADRNAAGYRKFAIMIEVEQIEDEKIALEMLRKERVQAEGARLKGMLDKRIERLEGLATLRDAQREYEKRSGTPLTDPAALIEAGILKAFPQDPLRIGYEFVEGDFRLKKVKVAGIEERR
ncbi:MAG: hypothetical protein OQK54_01825 [Gammaproteobacteria bacterium]|nr:hypothetical protein [Gammaproteobacteria bacterium]